MVLLRSINGSIAAKIRLASEVADAVKREVNQVPGTLKRMAAGGIRVPFYVIYRTLRATVNNDNPPEEDHVVALFSIMEKQDEMYIPVMNGLNIRLMFAESWRVALKIMAIIHRMVSAEGDHYPPIDLQYQFHINVAIPGSIQPPIQGMRYVGSHILVLFETETAMQRVFQV